MTSARPWQSIYLKVGLLIASAMIILLYGYPIVHTYAYTDVYEFVYHSSQSNFINVFIQGGRPLFGLLNTIFLSRISSIQGLYSMHLFGSLGIFAAAFCFGLAVKKYLRSTTLAFIGAFVFLMTPGALLTGMWAAVFQVGWALALALTGGMLCIAGFTEFQGLPGRIRIVVGMLIGFAALFLQQPAFTAFIIPAFLYYLQHKEWRRLFPFFVAYGLMFMLYFVVHKLTLAVTELYPLDRSYLTTTPFLKMAWFVRYPMWYVAEDNFLFYPASVQWLIALLSTAIVLFGFYRWKKLNDTHLLLSISIWVIFMVSAYVPNLASSDNWVSYRTLSTLFLLKYCIVLYACRYLGKDFWLKAVMACFIALLFANAWYNMKRGFVDLQVQEYQLVKEKLSAIVPALRKEQKLVFVMPRFDFASREGLVRRPISDEFGNLSTSRNWVPDPMLRQMLKEDGRTLLEKKLKIIIVQKDSLDMSKFNAEPLLDVEELYPGIPTGTTH